MGQLKTKLIKYIATFRPKKKDTDSMRLIKWNTNFLILCLSAYISMTVFEWLTTGHPNLTEFRQFIVVVGGLTATFTLLSRWLNDADNDGIPDTLEIEDRRNGTHDPR